MFLTDRTHKMLILLNFAQKSLSFHPNLPWHSEEYSPMPHTDVGLVDHSGADLGITMMMEEC